MNFVGHKYILVAIAKLSEPRIDTDFKDYRDKIEEEGAVMEDNLKYSEITRKVIGCAMQVHKVLGNGFQEVIYQRALAMEMEKQGLSFQREPEMPIYYYECQIGTRRVDFLVEGKISVELKALSKLEAVHLTQAINYLEAYGLEVGLLLNFGARSLEIKRIMNDL